MRIFLTGATGYVGAAVARELIANGHSVTGLTRSDTGAKALAAAGVAVHRGTLEEPESIASGIGSHDAVVHTAFDHDFSRFHDNCEKDRRVITALGEALAGSDRPLVITSGIGVMADGRLVTEDDVVPKEAPNPRIASEHAAAAVAARGVKTIVVRLPQVHGVGDHAFTPMLIGIARRKGVAGYVGDGHNRWPAVHRFDAARLYRLAIEKGVAGARYHAVAEEGIPLKAIAETIARRLGVPARSLTAEEARDYFGWFAHMAAMDSAGSSARTRQALGWEAAEIGLIADLEGPHYFAAA